LTTYRKDGSAHTVPVWFRWTDEAFEVVIAKGDVKLRHLARDPRCVLVVFEAVRPFRGVEVRGDGELVEGDVTSARAAIAGRYLEERDGALRRRTPIPARSVTPAHSRQPTRLGSVRDPAVLTAASHPPLACRAICCAIPSTTPPVRHGHPRTLTVL
jgi:Pyridoxamine 5'-phosphate oxidase